MCNKVFFYTFRPGKRGGGVFLALEARKCGFLVAGYEFGLLLRLAQQSRDLGLLLLELAALLLRGGLGRGALGVGLGLGRGRFALRPAALDRTRYLRFAQFMQQQGLIPYALSIEEYATVLE